MDNLPQTPDPYQLRDLLWPHVTFYQQQRDVIDSVWANDETYVPAGNMLGKDFIAGFIVLAFFLSRMPCRIITTSIKAEHLSVLWGEIHRFVQESRHPLTVDRGGPLIVLQREIRRVVNGTEDPKSYVKGLVSDRGEGMSGHHLESDIPRTLFIGDEVSGLEDNYYTMASAWSHRMLFIGNCWPCENFFKHAIHGRPGTEDRGGDIPREIGGGYHRKVIRIKADDSPSVKLGLEEQRQGIEPTNRILVPGVLSFAEYQKRRKLWDDVRQCVGLDAEFWMGADVLMFPPDWLNRSEQVAMGNNPAIAIGCDPAEGGDKTAWAVIGERGLIELISLKTPDTTAIVNQTRALMRLYNVPPGSVCFDRGGGGKQHADRLRSQGFDVQTVAFGEQATQPLKQSKRWFSERVEEREERYAYLNRRAEMYGMLRLRLDPDETPQGFGIPRKYSELRRQLAPIPLQYDGEGRMYLPPKSKRQTTGPGSQVKTLIELLGCSPDEADALAIAVYTMDRKSYRPKAGVAF